MVVTSSLGEQIERALKEEILSGRLAPGQRIPVCELADRWQVSATPIRDALRHLATTGLVTVAPRRGFFVGTMSKREFKNIYPLLIALETLAVEEATPRIPPEELQQALNRCREAEQRLKADGGRTLSIEHEHALHELIIRYCDSPKLIEFIRQLLDLNRWARATLVMRPAAGYEQALPEHIRVMEAIQARDVHAACEALREHITNAFHRASSHWHEQHVDDSQTAAVAEPAIGAPEPG